MKIRQAVFGDQGWYPAREEPCRAALDDYRATFAGTPTGRTAGIVPHAGWVFSGRVAGWTFAGLAQASPEVVFVFGGHMGPSQRCICMPEGAWGTPLGAVPVHEGLAQELVSRFGCSVESPDRYTPDNTIELQMPMIKHTWPETRVVAVQVPPGPVSAEMGSWAAQAADRLGVQALALGSTDLTHYGANYGFTPKGKGEAAHSWSKQENDRPYIDHLLALRISESEDHALANHSACCPGAAAAAAAFARQRGVPAGQLIEHTTSHQVEARGEPRMWVGYASIVY